MICGKNLNKARVLLNVFWLYVRYCHWFNKKKMNPYQFQFIRDISSAIPILCFLLITFFSSYFVLIDIQMTYKEVLFFHLHVFLDFFSHYRMAAKIVSCAEDKENKMKIIIYNFFFIRLRLQVTKLCGA